MSKIKVLIYPRYNNKYLHQLLLYINKTNYISVRELDPAVDVIGYIYLIIKLIINKITGYSIIHIHWQHFSLSNRYINNSYQFVNAFIILSFCKVLGYKIIWTIHNIYPHDSKKSQEKKITSLLLKYAKAVIIHSRSTKQKLSQENLTHKNFFIIPHGNFIDAYKNNINSLRSKKNLKIRADTFTFLFIGYLRPYKGIEKIIENFKKLRIDYPNIYLIIAGGYLDSEYLNVISKKIPDTNIYFSPKYIQDNELQIYYNSADIVVLPYNEISTSGSGIAAFSFGKPIISPRMGSITDYPDNTGIYYDPADNAGLYIAMKQAIIVKKDLSVMGKNAFEYAKTLSWDKIVNKTIKVYREVLK